MPTLLRRLGLAAVLLAAALSGACAREAPCIANASCANGASCELDGRCRPLDARLDLRFARALRVAPRSFAWASRREILAGSVLEDAVHLGAGTERLVLAFPASGAEGTEIERATLVLHVHDAEPADDEPILVEVTRAKTRDLDAEPTRRSLRRAHRPRVMRRLEPRPGARLDLDVTELVRDAGVGRPFALIIHARHPDGVAFASPRALDAERRPHLDVLLR